MPLKSVIYASKGLGPQTLSQLPELVAGARVANMQNDITGMLVFDGRNYLQVVEGPSRMVDTLMAKILLDQRHSRLRVVSETRPAQRWCKKFSAGLLNSQRESRIISKLVRGSADPGLDVYQLCIVIAGKGVALP